MKPDRNISQSQLAHILGVDRATVKANMVAYGITRKFSSMSNIELDDMVKRYKSKKPASGFRYVSGHLRSHGIRIQRHRLLGSLHRVDGLGQILRHRTTVQRRKYKSSRPNALWHCDGHHKLILWGIVIHGFIDGNCRSVCLKFYNY
jgi:hypothetical protein